MLKCCNQDFLSNDVLASHSRLLSHTQGKSRRIPEAEIDLHQFLIRRFYLDQDQLNL